MAAGQNTEIMPQVFLVHERERTLSLNFKIMVQKNESNLGQKHGAEISLLALQLVSRPESYSFIEIVGGRNSSRIERKQCVM